MSTVNDSSASGGELITSASLKFNVTSSRIIAQKNVTVTFSGQGSVAHFYASTFRNIVFKGAARLEVVVSDLSGSFLPLNGMKDGSFARNSAVPNSSGFLTCSAGFFRQLGCDPNAICTDQSG